MVALDAPADAYDDLSSLPCSISDISLERHERDTSSGFRRVTTEFVFDGPDGTVGRGEDVTYETEDHDALAETGLPELTGEYTLKSFSSLVGEIDTFPAGPPAREDFRYYRRWGLESAALDLALRQAGTNLATVLETTVEPMGFVASTRLGDPPTTDRLAAIADQHPELGYKLDPTPDWGADVIDAIVDTVGADSIEILDLKGQYEGTEVDVPADPALYERVLEAFPTAVIEDPALTDATAHSFEEPAVRERVSWDAPIHEVEDVVSLPWTPDWLNIKPSRFGSLESLFETLAYCGDHDIQCYGGGQFELGVGRGQLQTLAGIAYPDAPNDLAPKAYNDPTVEDGLPASPLEPNTDERGFR